MHKFSQRSLDNLVGVHPDLVRVVYDVMDLQVMDFTVTDGLRTVEEQKVLFDRGYSKTMNSKHLRQSDGFGHAVDLCPYPVDWKDRARFGVLAGLMLACSKNNGIKLTWGGDWNHDGLINDHKFQDLPHFQLES